MLPVLIIGLGLGILQQLVGINTVMYYGPTIFKEIGFKGDLAQIIATFGMGCLNFALTIVAMFTVDKLGRKNLLLIGLGIAMVSLIVLGFVMKKGPENFVGGRILAVLSLIFYMCGYAYSIGCIFWLMISEIFPLNVRGVGMGFVASVQWAANFLVSVTFLSILFSIGAADTFWLYAVMCLVAIVFTVFYVPETKGVSLETIEANLEKGVSARNLGNPTAVSKKKDKKCALVFQPEV
jgi:MFS transporter, SP family, galactose:H+ symporter